MTDTALPQPTTAEIAAAIREDKLKRSKRSALLKHIFLALTSLVMIYPLLWLVASSLKPDNQIFGNLSLIPTEVHFDNYSEGWNGLAVSFTRFFLNSTFVTVLSVIGNVFSCSFAAYAFARLEFTGKRLFFALMLMTLMIPYHVVLIPQYILFLKAGWVNTYLPLIVPNFFSNAFNVFLVRQFVSRLPSEIDEAAMVDGLGFFGIYRRIMLPMLAPVLIAIGIFTLTATWGDFMGPLIYLNDEAKMPLALGVQYITSTSAALQAPPWNLVMVGSILLTVPMILVYYLGQRYLYEMDISGGSAGVK